MPFCRICRKNIGKLNENYIRTNDSVPISYIPKKPILYGFM